MDSTCRECGRAYIYARDKNHRRDMCNTCRTLKIRIKKKAALVAYKGGCCQRCGWTGDHVALEFHHRDRTQKSFGIGQSYNFTLERLMAEVDKCDLLCANCHAIIEANSQRQKMRIN